MFKILNANLTKLKKNKIYKLPIIFSIIFALIMICSQYNEMIKFGKTIEIEQLMLNYSPIIGIIIAIFTSLFLGEEYSEGAIRNKVIIGHKRKNIYLSNLIIVIITSIFSYIIYLIFITIIGIPLFGTTTISTFLLLMLLFCILVAIIAYSSIFTFIAMMISNKTITAITTILLTFSMMFYSLKIFDMLSQPEYIDSMVIKGDEREIIKTKNNHYLEGQKRKIFKSSIDIIPTGQMFQIVGKTSTNLEILPLYSIGITILFTTAGLILFKNKELK